MSVPGFLYDCSIANAVGAPYEEVVLVDGILESSTLLAVFGVDNTSGVPSAWDVSEFEVTDGELLSETADTDGYTLTVIWARTAPDES